MDVPNKSGYLHGMTPANQRTRKVSSNGDVEGPPRNAQLSAADALPLPRSCRGHTGRSPTPPTIATRTIRPGSRAIPASPPIDGSAHTAEHEA